MYEAVLFRDLWVEINDAAPKKTFAHIKTPSMQHGGKESRQMLIKRSILLKHKSAWS
jgi:hypothetical protein